MPLAWCFTRMARIVTTGFIQVRENFASADSMGADVFQWQVLREVPSESYRPGEWNYLRIRVQGPELSCYCNDQLVVEFRDDTYTHGRVGLAKFRDTEASFKGFAVGQKLSSPRLASDLSARLLEMLQPREGPSLLEAEFAKEVSKFPETSGDLLEAEAKRLEQRGAGVEATGESRT